MQFEVAESMKHFFTAFLTKIIAVHCRSILFPFCSSFRAGVLHASHHPDVLCVTFLKVCLVRYHPKRGIRVLKVSFGVSIQSKHPDDGADLVNIRHTGQFCRFISAPSLKTTGGVVI